MTFEGVSVRLGDSPVLSGLELAVREGETLVLLGRSGAGKTTALRLVNRLLLPDEGVVRVEGKETDRWDPIALRRRMGTVIQEVGLFPHLTVARNVETVPRLLGWPADRRAARTAEVLELVGLDGEGIGERYPRELSGGQRQRVGVARALAAEPHLLLCDEPFGALDPITRGDLQREFRTLVRGSGRTILFVTHDVAEALYLGDRIALLDGGRLRFLGTTAEFEASGDEVVTRFRGEAAP
ncbi:MAG: ATP-binding cassette domain-containing protein [Gemmatimonadota bacterium]